MNRKENIKVRHETPAVKANFFSRITFWWLKEFFQKGYRRPIEEDDLYDTLPEHKSDMLSDKFTKLWEEELKRKSPNLLRVITKAYGAPVIVWGFLFCIVETLTRIGQPLSLGGLVSYFAPGQTEISKNQAYIYAMGIIVCSILPVITFHPFILFVFQIGMKIRLACCSLIYRKALKLSKSSTFDGLNGQVINLLSNDVGKFDIAMCFIHDLWKGPLEALLLGYFIYREIGVSAVIGMAFLMSFIPLQAWVGKKAASFRMRTAKRTDIRVRFMNEIIQGIQVIKMYTWEKSFAAMVEKIRKKEINAVRGSAYVRAMLFSFHVISRFSLFLSLVSYIYFGNIITARKVFIASSLYNHLNLSMVQFWPLAITCCAEGYISTIRIRDFLLSSEEKPQSLLADTEKSVRNGDKNGKIQQNLKHEQDQLRKSKNSIDHGEKIVSNQRRIHNEVAEIKSIVLRKASAVWSLNEQTATPIGIVDIDLRIEAGKLCAVIGQVGAGKSTLLNIIIGDLMLDEGSIECNGRISYASQEPWVFEGTIRNNIVFVDEYDEKRYREVVKVCALNKDFALLPHGDGTIVGERGVSLSGGQKARVSLARAIYRQADIYLLDDPLSAVDTHVGKHIFERCVKDYLQNKVCILVTHQLQYLKDVEHLVLLGNGRMVAQGSYRELQALKNDSILALMPEESVQEIKQAEQQNMQRVPTIPSIHEATTPDEIEQETQAIGAVSFSVYKSYFKSINSLLYFSFVALLFVFGQAALSGVDYFVAVWVNWEEGLVSQIVPASSNLSVTDTRFFPAIDFNETVITDTIDGASAIEEERLQYIYVYTILMAVAIYLILHRTFAFFKLCLRASINLHDKLFRGITRATMYFFSNNPSGRILNRFSKDIGAIDTALPSALLDCVIFFLELIAIMTIVGIVNYWLLLPTLVMAILFYIIRLIYINTARSLKRFESMTRSPVYSHMNATLQGLSTIRAFNAQKVLQKEFDEHQDLNTSAWYLVIVTNRAFALWLDLVCVLYILIVTLSFLVIGDNAMGGNVGLALTQVVSLIGMCQWGMRQTAELENQMTSVERVVEYSELESEPALESAPENCPPVDWPSYGAIEFRNLSFRYAESSEVILKNLSFRIDAKEKIGIVGRTGAGKSSIIQAIFRMANLDGVIIVDGVDTQKIGLHELRSKISIIPQDPVLFSGTLRSNLDPFEEKSDAEIWNALTEVELKVAVNAMVGGLDCKMSDGGSNFSMGQKQLVCLARAILRNNRILVLDEATANVDPETDKLIQTTIRTKFSSCTVLTIAHRLHTVMDSDRVLVMDAGCVVEFDHPYELLQNANGSLRQLVDQTGDSTAELLAKIAKQSFIKLNPVKHVDN